ncbi:hypothetical protein BGZ94_006803 [Podila epigama]|nr:hypothetical protein BGZ94_006803 [Podila epigama]
MSIPTLPQVIQQFYSSHDPVFQKSAQEYLHNLQKENFAWELASHLLASSSENSQFFGAHTHSIPEDRVEWMKNELIRWIVRYSQGPAFIRTKLCLALSVYAMRAVPTYWTEFIASTCQELRSRVNQPVDGVYMSQQAMEVTLLEFLTIVPEELGRMEIEPVRKAKLSNEVTRGLPTIISFIQEILLRSSIPSKPKALVCLRSWVQYGVTFDILQPILGLVLNALLDDLTFDSAAEVWSEIMSSKAAARHQNTICEGLMPCFASEWAKAKHLESVQTESEDVGKNLCQLLSTFGDNFSDWIAARFLRPDITVYLEMMMGFAGFPGYYAEDETISDLTLNFWYMLQESLSELPSEDAGSGPDDDDDRGSQQVLSSISSASNTIGLDQQSIQTIKEASIHVYTRLIEVLRKKLEFPVQSEWHSWTKDIRQEFAGHRQEVADTLINSYHVLHQGLLSRLIDTCALQLNQYHAALANPSDNHRLELVLVQLEATLYCIKALAEVVPHTENVQLPRFFSDQIFGRLPSTIVCRARETALTLVGSYADWFKIHPTYLLPALNFVIPALQIPQMAPYAARALKSICDTCRESLVDAIDAFMNVFANVEATIDASIKGSVVYSIATVIQTLPTERSIQPMAGLLGDIFRCSKECIEARRGAISGANINVDVAHASIGDDLDPVAATMLRQLDLLLSCCKGLQSPYEDEIRTPDERIQVYQQTVEERRKALSLEGLAVELARSMEQVIQGAVLLWPHEIQIAEKTCQIIKTMMTASQFCLIYLPFTSLIRIIETGFQQHAYPCWLDAAARMVSVYYFETTGGTLFSKMSSTQTSVNQAMLLGPASSGARFGNGVVDIVEVDERQPSHQVSRPRTVDEMESESAFVQFLVVLVNKTMEGMRSVTDIEEKPDVIHSFFAVLSQFVRHAPLAFYSIPPEQTESVMNFAIAGLAIQDRLALKAILMFLIEFVNQNYSHDELKQRIDNLAIKIGSGMVRGIISGIGGQVPRSMVPQLNDCLYPLVGRYPEHCRNWIQSLLSETNFPSPHADDASKEKFLKGIMQTRSPKKFRDEVHQFSNKCRQIDGSAFGSAI